LPPELRAAVWDKAAGTCWYCQKTMHPIRDFTVDHVVAFAKGGSDDLDNLVPCCRLCNLQKRTESAETFSPRPAGSRRATQPRLEKGESPIRSIRRVRLAEARKAKGLSIIEVAIRAQLSSQTLKRLEQPEAGGPEPSMRTVRRLMEALGVSKEGFVYWEQVDDDQAA